MKSSLITFLLCLCSDQLFADVNLALGKKYIFSPKPNYRLCTDNRDYVQLTDGVFSDCYWGKTSTVGWDWPVEVPQITIDLGRDYPIEQVNIHTASGTRGGVFLPHYAVVLLSTDDKMYWFAAFVETDDATKKTASEKSFFSYTLKAKEIHQTSRFVKVLIQPGGTMVFTDEIEVIKSEARMPEAPKNPVLILSGDVYSAMHAVEERLELVAAIRQTQQALESRKQSFQQVLLAEMTKQMDELYQANSKNSLATISQPQLLNSRQTLGQIRTQIYCQIYKESFVVIPADPMQTLAEREMVIVSRKSEKENSISLWQGEYGAMAFNLINCGGEPVPVSVSVSPLAGQDGQTISSEKVFTLRRAEFVYGTNTGSIADVLVLQGKKPFEAAPGQVQQLWLALDTKGLKPGDYAASLAFFVSGRDEPNFLSQQAIRLTVEPIQLPEKSPPYVCTWAYPTLSMQSYLPNAAEDLKTHYTNVQVIPRKNIPFPDERGFAAGIVSMSSTAQMDNWLKLNRDSEMFLLFLGFNSQRKDSGFFGEWMTPIWKQNFKQWLSELTEHLKGMGIGYEKFALYPFDEYIGDDFYELARFVKQADPKINIYANSFGSGPQEFMRLRNSVDIWCLHQMVAMQRPEWLESVRSFGKQNWTYKAAGPVRAANPLDHYRKMAWWAFKNNLTGIGFWTYADTDSPRWHDYGMTMGHYGVVYGSSNAAVDTLGEKIIPSRRWEIWRKGIEDYKYLYVLEKKIEEVQKINPEKARQVQKVLIELLDSVLLGDSAQIEQARQQVTKTILELKDFLH